MFYYSIGIILSFLVPHRTRKAGGNKQDLTKGSGINNRGTSELRRRLTRAITVTFI
jgi:hypothetical protein